MNKIIALTITTVMATLISVPTTYAEEATVDCEVNPTDESCIMLLDSDTPESWNATSTPTDNCVHSTELNCMPPATEETEDDEDIDDQVEVIEEVEEEAEPEMWPVYVSLGALGTAIIVFILLNFFTEQKRK